MDATDRHGAGPYAIIVIQAGGTMTELGMTFNQVAELYDRMRPRYPAAFFDRIGDTCGLAAGSRVLELGSGTGIATKALLEGGWAVDCVEPGGELIDVAKQRLAAYSGLTFHQSTFEAWELPEVRYDLVFSATAFHWIDAAIRYRKAHNALRDDGSLAVMQYLHVAGGDEAMFDTIQDCYVRHMPGARRQRLRSTPKRTPTAADMRKSGLFEAIEVFQTMEVIPYTRNEYLELLSTYSGHRMLDEVRQRDLFECIGHIIDRDGGGVINKAYAFELVIGRVKRVAS
jgi:SAM-dependent methyltransferase